VPAALPLRERKKRELRGDLNAVALARFQRHGFEATTVDAIVADAGVSRRTFFRYFATKEAVVFEGYAERLAHFRRLAKPLPEDGSAFRAVRRACLEVAKGYDRDASALLRQQRIVRRSAALTAYELDLDRGWLAAIEQVLAEDLPKLDARILAGAVLGVIRAALGAWFEANGRVELVGLGERAFALLEAGSARPGRRSGRSGR
jgi:AcrR family transcriptional regulator